MRLPIQKKKLYALTACNGGEDWRRRGDEITRLPLRTVPTNSKVFLRGLLNMWEKQILTSDIEIQKEINNICKKL